MDQRSKFELARLRWHDTFEGGVGRLGGGNVGLECTFVGLGAQGEGKGGKGYKMGRQESKEVVRREGGDYLRWKRRVRWKVVHRRCGL